ncbi:hypothetical protein PoB_003990400 [Plakobranchus ocellatus]|uniref:Uncharacterized protein n=1 Tax=Plakobranchus ocellatus TaxID=259542 RepID=A0AAV4B065_9GAST|nr:hypothetical protein PoB_003990400 [Plakobranchus ocellatus]
MYVVMTSKMNSQVIATVKKLMTDIACQDSRAFAFPLVSTQGLREGEGFVANVAHQAASSVTALLSHTADAAPLTTHWRCTNVLGFT